MAISYTGSDCDGWSFPRPKQPCIWKFRVGRPRPSIAVTSLLQLHSPRHHRNPFAWCQRLGIHSIFSTNLIRLLPYFVREEKQFLPQTPGAPLARPLMGARAASLPLALFVTGGEVDDEPTDQVISPFPLLEYIPSRLCGTCLKNRGGSSRIGSSRCHLHITPSCLLTLVFFAPNSSCMVPKPPFFLLFLLHGPTAQQNWRT